MDTLINGLHHVTALASDPQQNVDFYTGILGLRLVKRTVNFDAPEVYHLYYGNADGSPGTIMTFFPYVGLPRGKQGAGQTSFTAFAIPEGSVQYWLDRLTGHGVEHRGPEDRFAETVITLYDNDGLGLELVAASGDTRQPWENGAIPPEHAVRGFHSITLLEEGYERTAELLTGLMDHHLLVEAGNRFRYASGADRPGHLVDIVCSPESRRGLQGAGTVHHVAFATPSDEGQRTVRGRIARAGFNVTPVIDRNYFHSIYFREPGSVLFEVATVPPGFAVDEPVAALGSALKLPAQYERYRAELERTLPPLAVRRVD
jgi:glyoxalase family protein